MTDYEAESAALWARAEDDFHSSSVRADECLEALVYHELARTLLEARTKACRKAEARLRKAVDDLTRARADMLAAADMAEDTARLVAMRRET